MSTLILLLGWFESQSLHDILTFKQSWRSNSIYWKRIEQRFGSTCQLCTHRHKPPYISMGTGMQKEWKFALCCWECRCICGPCQRKDPEGHTTYEGQKSHETLQSCFPPFRRRVGWEDSPEYCWDIRWLLVCLAICQLMEINLDSIFELQQRNYSSLVTIFCLWPMLMLTSVFHYRHDPVYMFFTYVLPWIPFVVQFDGLMSMLRTRTPAEVYTLLEKEISEEELNLWNFQHGEQMHTWPFGWLSWIICTRKRWISWTW